jgi:hypothetical protein
MVLLIISLLIGLLLYGIGFLLNEKNASSMLSGYNTMSDKDKKEVKISEYIRFFRKFHFYTGILIMFFSLLFYFTNLVDYIGFSLLFFSLAGYTFFIFKSQFYFPPHKRKTNLIAFYIMLIINVAVIILLFVPYQTTQVQIFDNQLVIGGVYGEELPINQIEHVDLTQQLPSIKMKTNGFAMSSIKKGWFKTSDGKKVKLMVNDMKGPFLQIDTAHDYSIIIGLEELDEELLFHQLELIIK